jgi:hypothetical protein
MILRLVIYGAPRTKKTSNRLVRAGDRHRVLPSKAWTGWAARARIEVCPGEDCQPPPLDGVLLNCTALFYRDANRGDAVGYYQGLADLLEKRGVIVNDRCLVSWDGSRLLIDRENPRVEVTLTRAA